MQVPMAKIHVLGHRRRLDDVLEHLYETGSVQLIDVTQDASLHLPPLSLDEEHVRQIEQLRYLRARLDAALALAPLPALPARADVDLAKIEAELDADTPQIERLAHQLDDLGAELDTLPRYVASLKRLLPLVPELPDLAGYEVVALLIDVAHQGVIGDLNAEMEELIGSNFTILSDRVDAQTIGAVLVFPRKQSARVQDLLGHERVTRVRLPDRFAGMPFQQAISAMERRLMEVPAELDATRHELQRLIGTHIDWPAARVHLDARIAQLEAVGHLGATPHTFVLSGWMPRRGVATLRSDLARKLGGEVIVEEVAPAPSETPPVLLSNPPPARPFEFLVRLLSLPRYGALDPTILMTIFLPLFFGMMLGDVAYGLILLALVAWVRRRFRHRSRVIADLGHVLMLSAAWATVWGVVYAEFFGDLGHRWFGWEPLWINREEAIEPLLVFTIAVGAAHVILGLLLGVWGAARSQDRRLLTQRIAMLVALSGLFLIVAVAAGQLPAGFVSPGVAGLIVGLVLLVAAEGALGLVTGPLELIGTVGNILSYLRIGAIGIASVYLARVANELGATGPLWLGIIIAALFHALNVALGAFSPTIQSLRLHYVEFFSKFYEEGGREYEPFGNGSTATSSRQ